MTRGIYTKCQQCQYIVWNSEVYAPWKDSHQPPTDCPRCKRKLADKPKKDEFEDVCVNGRMVRRKKA